MSTEAKDTMDTKDTIETIIMNKVSDIAKTSGGFGVVLCEPNNERHQTLLELKNILIDKNYNRNEVDMLMSYLAI